MFLIWHDDMNLSMVNIWHMPLLGRPLWNNPFEFPFKCLCVLHHLHGLLLSVHWACCSNLGNLEIHWLYRRHFIWPSTCKFFPLGFLCVQLHPNPQDHKRLCVQPGLGDSRNNTGLSAAALEHSKAFLYLDRVTFQPGLSWSEHKATFTSWVGRGSWEEIWISGSFGPLPSLPSHLCTMSDLPFWSLQVGLVPLSIWIHFACGSHWSSLNPRGTSNLSRTQVVISFLKSGRTATSLGLGLKGQEIREPI